MHMLRSMLGYYFGRYDVIEITQHIFKEEILAEDLMKTHACYNIL